MRPRQHPAAAAAAEAPADAENDEPMPMTLEEVQETMVSRIWSGGEGIGWEPKGLALFFLEPQTIPKRLG